MFLDQHPCRSWNNIWINDQILGIGLGPTVSFPCDFKSLLMGNTGLVSLLKFLDKQNVQQHIVLGNTAVFDL